MIELLKDEKIESLMIKDYEIIQSTSLYRFTSDAVMLSRFAKARKGEVVADVCSGSGIVGLHFYALNDDFVRSVKFFELQKQLADMNEKSILLNELSDKMQVVNTDVNCIDEKFFDSFSLVLCNPPYKKQASGFTGEEYHLAVCKHEITVTLDQICKTAFSLLKNGGRFCLCQKCERLNDVILSLNAHSLKPSRIRFVSGNAQSAPYLVLVEAVKGVSPQLKVENLLLNDAKDFSGTQQST